MENDLISDIIYDLRTPLTCMRSLSEILHDYPNMDESMRQEFLGIIIQESEKLTRRLNRIFEIPNACTSGSS